jgi:hypothetical protein
VLAESVGMLVVSALVLVSASVVLSEGVGGAGNLLAVLAFEGDFSSNRKQHAPLTCTIGVSPNPPSPLSNQIANLRVTQQPTEIVKIRSVDHGSISIAVSQVKKSLRPVRCRTTFLHSSKDGDVEAEFDKQIVRVSLAQSLVVYRTHLRESNDSRIFPAGL